MVPNNLIRSMSLVLAPALVFAICLISPARAQFGGSRSGGSGGLFGGSNSSSGGSGGLFGGSKSSGSSGGLFGGGNSNSNRGQSNSIFGGSNSGNNKSSNLFNPQGSSGLGNSTQSKKSDNSGSGGGLFSQPSNNNSANKILGNLAPGSNKNSSSGLSLSTNGSTSGKTNQSKTNSILGGTLSPNKIAIDNKSSLASQNNGFQIGSTNNSTLRNSLPTAPKGGKPLERDFAVGSRTGSLAVKNTPNGNAGSLMSKGANSSSGLAINRSQMFGDLGGQLSNVRGPVDKNFLAGNATKNTKGLSTVGNPLGAQKATAKDVRNAIITGVVVGTVINRAADLAWGASHPSWTVGDWSVGDSGVCLGGSYYVDDGQNDSAGYFVEADPTAIDENAAGTVPSVNIAPIQQPANRFAELVRPHKNQLPSKVTVADRAIGRKIKAEFDNQLNSQVDNLLESYESLGLAPEQRDSFVAKHVKPNMDAAAVATFTAAVTELDVDAFQRAGKQLEISSQQIQETLPCIKLSRGLADLKKAIDDGESAEKITALSRRLKNAARELSMKREQREEFTEAVENLADAVQIREALEERPLARSGALVDAPQGEVPVVYYPQLAPAGKVFLIGREVLAVGTASKGDLVVSRDQADEILNVVKPVGDPIEAVTQESAKSAPRSGTVIINPRDSGTNLSYTINDYPFTLEPGKFHHLPSDQTWTISFDRGNGTNGRYTLSDGTFIFTPKNAMWDLESRKIAVTLENPSLTGRFHAVVENEKVVIPAGRTLSIKSAYPVVVGFDRGDGSEPVYKKLLTGNYAAAVNQQDGLWELYADDGIASDDAAEGPPGVGKTGKSDS
jgi:hypothetical protein